MNHYRQAEMRLEASRGALEQTLPDDPADFYSTHHPLGGGRKVQSRVPTMSRYGSSVSKSRLDAVEEKYPPPPLIFFFVLLSGRVEQSSGRDGGDALPLGFFKYQFVNSLGALWQLGVSRGLLYWRA
jgi:hypothetical protein